MDTDFLEQYNKALSNELKDSSELHFLQSKDCINRLLESCRMNEPVAYFSDLLSECISSFAKSDFRDRVVSYLDDEIKLHEISRDFIHFLFDNKLNEKVNLDDIVRTIGTNLEPASDFLLKKLLLEHKFPDTINIFGFGLGDGSYEKDIKNFLVQQGHIKDADVYGYDPYAEKNEDVTFLSEEELASSHLRVDLLIARWSLHHVPYEDRWSSFSKSLDLLTKGGVAIAIEHSYIDLSEPPVSPPIYRFFNSALDILANIGYRENWFTCTAPDVGKNFFLDFLDSNDLKDIADSTTKQISTKITTCGPLFPCQSMIQFTRLL